MRAPLAVLVAVLMAGPVTAADAPSGPSATMQAAAENGDARAQYELGMAYAGGKGVTQDDVQARYWLQKAVDQKHADAALALQALYASGGGGPVDWYRVRELNLMAAAQGRAEAQYNLGSLYMFGHGVRQDVHTAIDWYEKAAAQGHPDAEQNLGSIYLLGYEDLAPDVPRGVALLERAASHGNTYSMYYLGTCYAFGRGVYIDPVMAHVWLSIAADHPDEPGKAQKLLTWLEERNMTPETISKAEKEKAKTVKRLGIVNSKSASF